MAKLTDLTSYAAAQKLASLGALWDLFDRNREDLNIAHECIDRHTDGSGRIADADGSDVGHSSEAARVSPSIPHFAAL